MQTPSPSPLPSGAFVIERAAESAAARAARLVTAHGEIQTPVFMPVGTAGAVKAMDPAEVWEMGYRIILGNTFHLEMRPGSELIGRFGGLRRFMDWPGAILTDSGGYQVFSLASLRRINDDGVEFQSPIDGDRHVLTPESAMQIQRNLGSDIVMAFDECIPYPADRDYAAASTERTLRWLRRCAAAPLDDGQLLFGIVQGGMHADLRRDSARATADVNLPGHAIGGLSVGEPKELMREMMAVSAENLPRDRPLYAMGVGTPADFVECIGLGVDMFDCVQPTRHARNGQLFTRRGTLNVRNARFREETGPADPACGCPLCRRFSLAYVRHLFAAREILAVRLMTAHNLQFFQDFMSECRAAILEGRWEKFQGSWRELWRPGDVE